MAKSGLQHIGVGPDLSRTEWESEETHQIVHGNSFPASPVERQLFYRDDLHEWYIYDATGWVNLQSQGYPPKRSIELDALELQLVGDVAAPPPDYVYGTDAGGNRGWKADPAGAVDFPRQVKPLNSNNYVIPGWYQHFSSNAAMVAGRMCYVPIFVPETRTYERIGIRVSTASAGEARLGIYDWDSGSPKNLVVDGGKIDTSTTGSKEVTISELLARAFYFIALVCDATPGVLTFSVSSPGSTLFQGFSNTISVLPKYLTPSVEGEAGQVAAGLTDPAVAPTHQRELMYTPALMLREVV